MTLANICVYEFPWLADLGPCFPFIDYNHCPFFSQEVLN